MSNKTNNKRFLVTYADQEISKDAAVKLLKVDQSNVKEGVSFMSADREALKDNVLHFDNLGISLLELTSENAKKLATQKGILAVEEDAKVYALDIEIEGVDPDYQWLNLKQQTKVKEGQKLKASFTKKKTLIKLLKHLNFKKKIWLWEIRLFPKKKLCLSTLKKM